MPDRLAARAFVNARIHTMATRREDGLDGFGGQGGPTRGPPWTRTAEAMLWEGDTILAVGTSAEVLRLAKEVGATVTDLAGRIVLPGFVDAHMHFIHAGMKRLRPDLRGASSLEDCLARLEAWLRANPGSDPVTGEGWDESRWPGRTWPTRADIDLAAAEAGQPDRPIVLRRIDGHVAVAGSAALPAIRRRWDSDRQVDLRTGLLLEEPSLYLNEVLPASPEVLDRALQEACRIAHERGVTTVGDYSQAPFRQALQRAAARGSLTVRVASSVYAQQLDAEVAAGFRTGRRGLAPQDLNGPVNPAGGAVPGLDGGSREAGGTSPFLKEAGLKVFLDGSLGAHTAALRHDYHDAGGTGQLNWSDAELEALLEKADAAGIQVHAHAIGDAAIDQGLRAFGRLPSLAQNVSGASQTHDGLQPGGSIQGPAAGRTHEAQAPGSAPGTLAAGRAGTGSLPEGMNNTRALPEGMAGAGTLPEAKARARTLPGGIPGTETLPGGVAGAKGALADDGPNPLRHRFEHFEIVHDEQLQATAALGIVSSSQPNFVGEWSDKGGMYEARLGELFRLNNRFRTMKRAGVPLAFGSDGMPFGPLVGLQAAVLHPVPAERLDPLEAVWHYTWMAAWSLHWDGMLGSLEPGKKADIVVLDTVETSGPPGTWGILETVVGGTTRYRKGETPHSPDPGTSNR